MRMLNLSPSSVVLVLVLFALPFILLGVADHETLYYEICEKNIDTGHKDCATYGVALFFWLKIGKFLDAAAPAFTALATIAIAFFTYTLKKATDQLRFEGKSQRELSEKTADRQLRAYISVEPDGIDDFIPDDRVIARINFHNTGSIFARDVYAFVDRKLSDDGELPETAFPIGEPRIRGDNVIGPRANILYATAAIPKSEIDSGRGAAKIIGKNFYLYVWGQVWYHDGITGGRYTKFCHRYNFSGVPEGEYTVRPKNYRYHHHGNKIDEQD